MWFTDRADAGHRLATRLRHLRGKDTVVLGLPRGGVPVAFQVARALDAPLDVIVVRKLGVPYQPELAMGAIGEDGVRVLNTDVVHAAHVTPQELGAIEDAERVELERRADRFRGGTPRVSLAGKTALVVDDGVATGATAKAACQVARAHGAAQVILAVPVAAPDVVRALRESADEVVCLETPRWFTAVGEWYVHFGQTSDDEVLTLLTRAREQHPVPNAEAAAADPLLRDDDVEIHVGNITLPGHVTIPDRPLGMVVFAHGSGSSRHSPRNRFVARVLNEAGLATLLFDLLTADEEASRALVFDIDLLASRLIEVTEWLRQQPWCAEMRIGYFGASTGAAAALRAAADSGSDVAAVVSRGGRPDLAATWLPSVRTPTLLIVGGRDDIVLDLNRRAKAMLRTENELAVVAGATHLFEEPGTLEWAAHLARDWFLRQLAPRNSPHRQGRVAHTTAHDQRPARR